MKRALSVGIVTANPVFSGAGYSIRPYELSRGLANLGAKVHIFSPFEPTMPLGRNLEIHHVRIPTRAVALSKVVHSLIRRISKKPRLAELLLFKSETLRTLSKSFASAVVESFRRIRLDTIQYEQHIPAMAGLAIRDMTGYPTIADLHDIWPLEEILAGRLQKASTGWQALVDFEREIVEESDGCLVISNEMKELLAKTSCPKRGNYCIISNAGKIRRESRCPSKSPDTVVYAGTLEPWERTELLVQSISIVKKLVNRKINFLLLGKGPQLRGLKQLASKVHGTRIQFGSYQRSEIFGVLSKCDLGVVMTNKLYAKPLKVYDYMSVGLPVVSVPGCWDDVIRNSKCGKISIDSTPEEFGYSISLLMGNPAELNQCGENARRAIGIRYNWKVESEALLNFMLKFV